MTFGNSFVPLSRQVFNAAVNSLKIISLAVRDNEPLMRDVLCRCGREHAFGGLVVRK
jgi:hypothetical protein